MVYEQNIKQDKYKEEVTEALNKLSALQDKDVCTRQAIESDPYIMPNTFARLSTLSLPEQIDYNIYVCFVTCCYFNTTDRACHTSIKA